MKYMDITTGLVFVEDTEISDEICHRIPIKVKKKELMSYENLTLKAPLSLSFW